MAGHVFTGLDVRLENPAGLTGVWAEENTRASIWDAMYRKETFGTSGPHIKVRLFGGWGYEASLLEDNDWVKTAYAGGVPMGADLPPMKGQAPSFAVSAIKDPTSGNLDRIQIVKGWSRSGQSFEKIFDVVWAGDRRLDKWTGEVPPIESTVDVENATYTNSVGSVELQTVWTDPEFDPSVHAFYYARVLEIPTPRWTTIQAHQLGVAPPDVVPAAVQERAWSSPIWYTPSAEARKNAKPGTTVAALAAKGAKAVADAELKQLVVGKSWWVTNTITGTPAKIRYDADGNASVTHIGRRTPLPGATGDLANASYESVPAPYKIENGKLVTMLANTPFSMTLYKLGDKLYGARSNEFGYANYEFAPTGPADLAPLPAGLTPSKNQSEYLHAPE
jgi:hypothetical protein